jgi:spore coat protein U-like protein
VINAGTDPGKSAKGVSLAPVAQYKATASGEARPVAGQLDIGAYEVTGDAANTAAVTWTACGNEGATCSFSGIREVRFGANGTYTSKVITGSTPCTSAVFGDPVRGVAKSCAYSSATSPAPTTGASGPAWVPCAGEGGTCVFTGTREVRYGSSTSFATKTFTGSVVCSNAAFGDPAHGELKTCSYSSSTTGTSGTTSSPAPTPAPTSNDTGWTACAAEGGTCSFTGTRQVRFGANGFYAIKTLTGPVACSNAVFGDPAYKIAKTCSYKQ